MILNRPKFDAELAAAGVAVRGYNDNGPTAGRAVLADATIVGHDRALSHEDDRAPDTVAAAVYLAMLDAHDPAPTVDQQEGEREGDTGAALGSRRERLLAALVVRASTRWSALTSAQRKEIEDRINAAADRVLAVLG